MKHTVNSAQMSEIAFCVRQPAYQETEGFLRWSLTLYPAGSSNNCGSGSEAVSSMIVKVCFPTIGPERTERRLMPSSCECHSSFMLVIGWSLPMLPISMR